MSEDGFHLPKLNICCDNYGFKYRKYSLDARFNNNGSANDNSRDSIFLWRIIKKKKRVKYNVSIINSFFNS